MVTNGEKVSLAIRVLVPTTIRKEKSNFRVATTFDSVDFTHIPISKYGNVLM